MNSNVYIKEYSVEQNRLYVTGIQWPKESLDDVVLVLESESSEKQIEVPIKKDENIIAELPIETIYEWFKIEELETLKIAVKCLLSSGSQTFQLMNNTKKSSPQNYKIMDSKKTEERFCLLHSRNYGMLEISYDTPANLINKYVLTYMTKFVMKGSVISMEGSMDPLGYQLEQLCLTFRDDESKKYNFPIQITGKEGQFIQFTAKIDLNDIAFEPFFWDFYITVIDETTDVLGYSRMKVDYIPLRKDLAKYLIRNTYKKDNYIAFPYMTKAFNLCIQYRERHQYDSIVYKMKETVAVWTYKLFKKQLDKKCRWLICEKFANTAQDNSYYFFRYCCDEMKKDDVYYIIKKDSPDYQKVKKYGKRVIPFMSFRHMIYLQANCKMISSETRINFYAWKIGRGRVRLVFNDKPYVFLQHGVLGFKKVHNISKRSINAADLFITSSEFEKGIVKDYMQYSDEEIAVTGLARWDALVDKVGNKKKIVLMPTWRLWLEGLTKEQFRQTEYYHNYLELIQNPKLISLLKKHDVKMTFIIHPKIREFLNEFSVDSNLIDIYEFGETPINEKLMESSLLITDYSSVAWDMYYMKKPIIFYKFDLQQLEEIQGSYIDPRSEVIGDIVYDNEALLECMDCYMANGYKEQEKYAFNRNTYIKYQDQNNCKRIFDHICELDR